MRRAMWGIVTAAALLVTAYALAGALIPSARTSFVEALFAEARWRAFGHLGAGGIAMATGAFQFSGRLRFARPAVHRRLGTIYVLAVLVSGVSAALLAPVSTGGLAAHFGFGLLAILWLTTSATAYVRARGRDYASHREWMIRSYALCLAAVTLRIYLPLSQAWGVPFEDAYPAISWLCWVPNLVVAEWLLLRSAIAPLAPPGAGIDTTPASSSR